MQLQVLIVLLFSIGCYGGKLFGGPFGAFGGYSSSLAVVNQQRFKLKGFHIQMNNSINTANTTIHDNIEKSQQALDNELNAAKSASISALANCKQQFDSAVALIDTKSLENCDQSHALEWVKLQSNQLYGYHAQLGPIFAQCPFWPTSPDQEQCVNDRIKPIDDGAEALKDDVLAQIAQIVDTSSACVDSTSTQIRNAIAAANQQLAQCNV